MNNSRNKKIECLINNNSRPLFILLEKLSKSLIDKC